MRKPFVVGINQSRVEALNDTPDSRVTPMKCGKKRGGKKKQPDASGRAETLARDTKPKEGLM